MRFCPLYLKNIWKIHIFKVGHFGLQIAALPGKIQAGSWSIWNQHTKITLYTNFHAFVINLNHHIIYVQWLTVFLQNHCKSAILDCELQPSWAKSRVGSDRFEISVPKLPCVAIFMLLSLIWTIRPLNIWTSVKCAVRLDQWWFLQLLILTTPLFNDVYLNNPLVDF